MSSKPKARSKAAQKAAKVELMHLRLYVTGATSKSLRAIANIKHICEKYLPGKYSLEVIDIYQKPNLAKEEQIVAVPTLVKFRPSPLKRWIGDVTNSESVMAGLEIVPKS
jgi:circadian clock protein KaiB